MRIRGFGGASCEVSTLKSEYTLPNALIVSSIRLTYGVGSSVSNGRMTTSAMSLSAATALAPLVKSLVVTTAPSFTFS